MAANRMLERIRRGEKALGVALSSPSEELVEMYGRMGLDWVDFEGQHAALTSETVERLCRVADGFGITPTMRIPDHAESTILSFLDRGIKAMWVPNLQTKEEAEALVRYSFFAPIGLRSFTSRRVGKMGLHGGAKALMAEVNANTVIVPQLESITALNNLDEILTVDGIDYFGWGQQRSGLVDGTCGRAGPSQCRRCSGQGAGEDPRGGKETHRRGHGEHICSRRLARRWQEPARETRALINGKNVVLALHFINKACFPPALPPL